jgi:predicted DNA-binding transcriptional regulator YafY
MGKPFTMSRQEISRLEIIQRLLDRRLSQSQAADILHITTRQIQRLVRGYRQQGVSGIISKRRGKPSNHMIPQTIKDYAVMLIKTHYADFGPTLAAEKLLEVHDLKLAVETVRSLMIKSDIWITRDKKRKRAYQPRYRRDRFGELIQIDGSTHPWFEDRGPKCTVLVFIDDATSKLTTLYFTPSESTHTYFIATQQHLDKYGKPIAFYSDRLGVFKVNQKSTQEMIMTQFGRSLYELNIDLICAKVAKQKVA